MFKAKKCSNKVMVVDMSDPIDDHQYLKRKFVINSVNCYYAIINGVYIDIDLLFARIPKCKEFKRAFILEVINVLKSCASR